MFILQLVSFRFVRFLFLLSSLEGAAFQSRLPFDKMSSLEAASFPDLNTPMSHMFIQIRNRLLKMWVENPKLQLTSENALENMEVILYSNLLLQHQINTLHLQYFEISPFRFHTTAIT